MVSPGSNSPPHTDPQSNLTERTGEPGITVDKTTPALERRRAHQRRALRVVALALGAAMLVGAALVAVPELRWRSALGVRKAVGLLPDLTWSDVIDITRQSLGFRVRSLVRHGDPYAVIHDPTLSSADLAHGQDTFLKNCVRCHGPEAQGGLGPPLVGRTFSHGDSDWAVYRTITRGVPGTPMQPGFIGRRDVWPVIGYLRSLGAHSGSRRSDISDPTNVAVGEAPDATYQELLESSGKLGEWQLPGGSYNGQRFARDTQINTGNVAQLTVRWVHQFPSTDAPTETTPIVVGDYMFVSRPPLNVDALDARTGHPIWHYERPVPPGVRLCCLATTRGVAVLGRRVFLGTLDAHLIALDSTSGALEWEQEVADYKVGYSITSAPLPIGDLVITGIAGGEFPTHGSISAYDAATGKLRWRFNTIPAPGERGHETWGGDSWKTGGAATWGAGAFDPELGLLYWGTGTAAPDFNAALRPGDNLYANCLLALNPATGELAWYFQFLPGDDHDWDSIQTPALIDFPENGTTQRLLAVANRGGFFYVLDRRDGRFVRAAPFVRQTWALGLASTGKPIKAPISAPTPQGTFVYPSVNGATNWWPSAFSSTTNLYYVNVEEGGGLFFSSEHANSTNGLFVGGNATYGNSFLDLVRAIDPLTAKVRWERRNTVVTSAPRGGLLATAGGLLFGSDGKVLYALDAASGRELWAFDTGGHIAAPPMTFRSHGEQLIAVMAGQDLITFALPRH
jgi:alcohol dehydrogenase (cytochrome c)